MPISLGKKTPFDTTEWDRLCLARIGRIVPITLDPVPPRSAHMTKAEMRALGFTAAGGGQESSWS